MTVRTQTYRPTMNVGQVYLRVAGSAAPLRPIGNVSLLTLEIAEDEKAMSDYTQPGGGQWASVSRVTGVSANMTLHDLDPDNIARQLYGGASEMAGGSKDDEAHTAYQGGLIRLTHPVPTNVSITHGAGTHATETEYALGDWVYVGTHVYECSASGVSGASAPTWETDGDDTTDGTVVWGDRGAFAAVAGVDYEVRQAGVFILGGGIPDGCPILVTYDYAAYAVVEALTSGALVYELSFDGMNEADNNSPVVVDIFRLKISAAKSLSLISDDFASLEVTAKVLMDPTKSGVGTSKYFRTQMRSNSA